MTAMNSGAYCLLEADARGQVDRLLAETAANGGLAPCDVEQFWRDQAVAAENPFGENITQVPLGAICNWECVFDELGIDVDFWRYQYGEPEWAQEINKRYNELAERIVGRPLPSAAMKRPIWLRNFCAILRRHVNSADWFLQLLARSITAAA